VREALAQAGVGLGWVDAVAVGHRPGLIGSLLVGVSAAKALAWSLGRPLIGVDHLHGHLYSGMLRGGSEVEGGADRDWATAQSEPAAFPALGLVVSGGHTSLYKVDSWTKVTRLGATIDDAVGEAFDKVATILGLEYPGGPNVDKLAASAGADERAVELPVSRLGPESLDFSFSGLKTAVLYAAKGVPGRYSAGTPAPQLTEARKADLAASFQRAAVEAVILKLERAAGVVAAGQGRLTLVTGGGVTANSRLRRELRAWAAKRGADLRLPSKEYTVDNAAMIAGLGYEMLRAGQVSGLLLQAVPTTAC
jgi:N6-L-threonylcarbamoyladenine synthase